MRVDAKIVFYQPSISSLNEVLISILEKIYKRKEKSLVVVNNEKEAKDLDYLLWTYSTNSFLPHSFFGEPSDNPIWISTSFENSNIFNTLVIINEQCIKNVEGFTQIVDLFNFNKESLIKAKERMNAYRTLGNKVICWKQKPDGLWSLENE